MRSRSNILILQGHPDNAQVHLSFAVPYECFHGRLLLACTTVQKRPAGKAGRTSAWRARSNTWSSRADFRVDGLAVEADARRCDDVATIGMVGPVLELLRIRRRPG